MTTAITGLYSYWSIVDRQVVDPTTLSFPTFGGGWTGGPAKESVVAGGSFHVDEERIDDDSLTGEYLSRKEISVTVSPSRVPGFHSIFF